MSEELCPLCKRELAEPTTKHHLIPPSKGGKDMPTVTLHKVCQEKIHAVVTETEQKTYYNTIERLQEHEEIARFIKWLRNKSPEFYDKSTKMKR